MKLSRPLFLVLPTLALALLSLCVPVPKTRAADVTFQFVGTAEGTTELNVIPHVADLTCWMVVAGNGFEELLVEPAAIQEGWQTIVLNSRKAEAIDAMRYINHDRVQEGLDAYCGVAHPQCGECWLTFIYADTFSNNFPADAWRGEGVAARYNLPGVLSGSDPLTQACLYAGGRIIPATTEVSYVGDPPCGAVGVEPATWGLVKRLYD